MKMLIALFIVCSTSTPFAAEVVQTCQLGTKTSSTVALIRDHELASTHVYYLRQGGKRTPLFGTRELSRGSDVTAQCAGAGRRAMILSGEFTANALQGVVLTNSPRARTADRLDFAEKARPRWLYLGRDAVIVVVPTEGRGESDARYMLYRHTPGAQAEDQVEPANDLPPSHGYQVLDLTSREQ